jgi:hypothetical protein
MIYITNEQLYKHRYFYILLHYLFFQKILLVSSKYMYKTRFILFRPFKKDIEFIEGNTMGSHCAIKCELLPLIPKKKHNKTCGHFCARSVNQNYCYLKKPEEHNV